MYGTGNGNFKFPRDIGVDSLGRVYVADCLNYRIERFTQDGSFDAAWGAQGENNGQFEDHYGVSVDQDNNVFVADAGNNRIQKFTPDGVWLATIGSLQQGINPGQFYYPMGVEVYFPQPGVPSFTPTVHKYFYQHIHLPRQIHSRPPILLLNSHLYMHIHSDKYIYADKHRHFHADKHNTYTSTNTIRTPRGPNTSTILYLHADEHAYADRSFTYTPTNTFTSTNTGTFTPSTSEHTAIRQ